MAHRYRCKVPAGSFCASKRMQIRKAQRAHAQRHRVYQRPAVQFVLRELKERKKAELATTEAALTLTDPKQPCHPSHLSPGDTPG
jgi:hypothetical protein